MITEFKIFENVDKWIGPLYHGSRTKFDKFEHKNLGQDDHPLSYLGFHFTPSLEMAKRFARAPKYMIYTVEIKVNKTLKIKESKLMKDMLRWGFDNKYFYLKNIEDFLNQPYFSEQDRSIMDELNDFGTISDQVSHERLALGYKKVLISKGYDSIQYLNEVEFFEPVPKRYDWIVFDSENIKIIDSQERWFKHDEDDKKKYLYP